MARRESGRLAAVGAACLLAASFARAGTTHYYYDPVGRLTGALQTDGGSRTGRSDHADNPAYLATFQTVPPSAGNRLQSGGDLIADQSLVAKDTNSTFTVQEDGNLVLTQNSSVAWSSGTSGNQPGYLTMSSTGDLIFYGPDHSMICHTNTAGNSGAYAQLLNGGTLVIYASGGGAMLWSTANGGVCSPPS